MGIFYAAVRTLSVYSVSNYLNEDLGGTIPQMLVTLRAGVVATLTTFLILMPEIFTNILKDIQLKAEQLYNTKHRIVALKDLSLT